METLCTGDFLEFMRVALVKMLIEEGYGVSTGLFLQPSKASSGRTQLYSIELLSEGFTWRFPKNLGWC